MIPFRRNAVLVCFLTFAFAVSARAADVEKGKTLFEKCAACHSLEAGKNDDAPSLRGIFGRKIASIEDFRYSAAMKRSDVVWTESTLNTFVEDPQAFIPGNRMPFDGLKDKSEREDLLAYLELATKTAGAYEFRIPGTDDQAILWVYRRLRSLLFLSTSSQGEAHDRPSFIFGSLGRRCPCTLRAAVCAAERAEAHQARPHADA
jgi:cytochrome c2